MGDDQPIQERLDLDGAALQPRSPDRSTTADTELAVRLARALELRRALVFLDLESTGIDPRVDRIVEISLLRIDPDGGTVALDSLVCPGVPVPPASSAVHGIGDEDLAGAPPFAALAARVLRLLRGADVAGYNLARFDLPLLQAELRRAGHEWDWFGARVVDVCAIFKRMERRDLEAAYRFYCGRERSHAHTATGDVLATMEVLAGQLRRHPELPRSVESLDSFWRGPEGGGA